MADDPHGPPSLYPETYTVKEVIADLKVDLVDHLNRQDSTLADISTKVDTKADKADLLALSQKLDGHGGRITKLEEHRQDTESSKKFRNRAWAVAGTVGGIAAIIVAAFIDAHVH